MPIRRLAIAVASIALAALSLAVTLVERKDF